MAQAKRERWIAQLAESWRVQPATSLCCTQLLGSQLAGENSDFTLLHSAATYKWTNSRQGTRFNFCAPRPLKIVSKFRETHSAKFKKIVNLRPVVGLIFVHRPWTAKMAGLIFVRQHLYFPFSMPARSAATSLCAKAAGHAFFSPLTR